VTRGEAGGRLTKLSRTTNQRKTLRRGLVARRFSHRPSSFGCRRNSIRIRKSGLPQRWRSAPISAPSGRRAACRRFLSGFRGRGLRWAEAAGRSISRNRFPRARASCSASIFLTGAQAGRRWSQDRAISTVHLVEHETRRRRFGWPTGRPKIPKHIDRSFLLRRRFQGGGERKKQLTHT